MGLKSKIGKNSALQPFGHTDGNRKLPPLWKKIGDNVQSDVISLNDSIQSSHNSVHDTVSDRCKFVLKIPFVGEASYKFRNQIVPLIKSVLEVDVRPVFVSCKTSNYFSLKCSTPFPYKSNVVYLYKCVLDATTTYIGETTRHLITRVNEHYKYDKKSAIFTHIQRCEGCKNANLTVNNFVILKSCRGFLDSAIHESIFINKYEPTLNKKLGYDGKVIKLNAFCK